MRYVDTVRDGADNTLGTWLAACLRSESVEVAALRTGFFSRPVAQRLSAILWAVAERGGRVELVLGGEGEQVDPGALWELVKLNEAFKHVSVRVVTGPGEFHNAKTYYVRDSEHRAQAWVGSANLTEAGLGGNHEAAITLDSATDPAETIESALAGIEAYRRHEQGSAPLEAELIHQLERRQLAASASRRGPALYATLPLEDLLQPTVDEIDAVASSRSEARPFGVPTSFDDLDAHLGGLHPGTLTVLASRPSVGRSTLLANFIRSSALAHELPTAWFTLEQTEQQAIQRLLSAEARIRLSDMRTGRMTDDDWTRLAKRMSSISEAPLFVNATPAPQLDALVAEITELHAQASLRLVALDPLSVIAAPTEPGATRERAVSMVVRRLKNLALELHLPIVITADLKRPPDSGISRRPQLDDLRESDTIAQVADTVITIYRPDATEPDDPRMGEADLIVAKHRSGPQFTSVVAHQMHYNRFVDLAPEEKGLS